MKIVFWWNIPCKGISGVIKEFAKINNNEVIAITGKLSDSRLSMGWDEKTFYPAKHIFLNDEEWKNKSYKLLAQYKDYNHIFNGYYYPKRIVSLIQAAIKLRITYSIFSEAPSNHYNGLKKIEASIYHNFLLNWHTKSVRKNAQFIFCLSGFDKTEIKKLERIGWKKSQIVPFGYFTEEDENRVQSKTFDMVNIFCPGNLVKHKGVNILLKALKNVLKYNSNFHCHITGKGNEKQKLINLCDNLGLQNNVTFHGVLEQKTFDELQQKMQLLVAPGLIEPWGIRINEAIQRGQAIIVSDKIGAKELIQTSQGGALFESGSSHDLANKILEFINNPNKLNIAMKNNLEYAKNISPSSAASYVNQILKMKPGEKLPLPTWL